MQLAPDRRHEPGRSALLLRRRQPQLRLARRRFFFGRNHLRPHHLGQHQVAALHRQLGEAARIVVGGRLGQRGQERRLRQGKVAGGTPEVSAGGSLHAVVAVREVDLVQVQLQDLLLAEDALDPARDDHLRELAPERAGPGEAVGKDVARKLHGDGAGALLERERPQVAPDRSRHAAPVDTAVLVEPLVLDGEERAGQLRRHGGEWHHDALFRSEARQQLAFTVENQAGLRGPMVVERVHGRAPPGHRHHSEGQERERCRGAPRGDAHTLRRRPGPDHLPRNNRPGVLPPKKHAGAELPPSGRNSQGLDRSGAGHPAPRGARVRACLRTRC